jgi:protein-tyrosine phosphatase
LLDYFDDAVRYIDDQLKVTNVLVHCYAGISRSTTIVAAYLMKKREISSKQALNLISQYRSQIGPNPGTIV